MGRCCLKLMRLSKSLVLYARNIESGFLVFFGPKPDVSKKRPTTRRKKKKKKKKKGPGRLQGIAFLGCVCSGMCMESRSLASRSCDWARDYCTDYVLELLRIPWTKFFATGAWQSGYFLSLLGPIAFPCGYTRSRKIFPGKSFMKS